MGMEHYRNDFHGWKHVAGPRDERRSAAAKAIRKAKREQRAPSRDPRVQQWSQGWVGWDVSWDDACSDHADVEAAWRAWRDLEKVDEKPEDEEEAKSASRSAGPRSSCTRSSSFESASSGRDDHSGKSATRTLQKGSGKDRNSTGDGKGSGCWGGPLAWDYYNRPFPTRPADDFEQLRQRVQEALQGDLAAALAANPKGGGATATSPTEAEMPTPPSPTSPASPPPPAAPAPPSSSNEAALPSGNKEAVQTAQKKRDRKRGHQRAANPKVP